MGVPHLRIRMLLKLQSELVITNSLHLLSPPLGDTESVQPVPSHELGLSLDEDKLVFI